MPGLLRGAGHLLNLIPAQAAGSSIHCATTTPGANLDVNDFTAGALLDILTSNPAPIQRASGNGHQLLAGHWAE